MLRPSQASDRPSRTSGRPVDLTGARLGGAGIRTSDRRAAAVALAAVGAATVSLEPVGSLVLDRIWLGSFAGLLAYLASHARRLWLYVAVGVALASVSGFVALAIAVAALGLVIVSDRHLERSSVFTRGLGGGLVTISALVSCQGASPVRAAVTLALVSAVLVSAGYRYLPIPERRLLGRSLFVMVVLAGLASGAGAASLVLSQGEAASAANDFERGIAVARAGDIETAQSLLESSANDIDQARSRILRLGAAARVVPGVAQNINALLDVLENVAVVTDRGSRTASALDLDSLTLQQGKVDVGVLADLQNPLRRLDEALGEVVDGADASLAGPLVPPIRDRLSNLRSVAAAGRQETMLAVQAADALPTILGADGPRRYLVLFTSPAEARGRFGFPGAYAEVVVDNGRLDVVDNGSVSQTFMGVMAVQAAFDRSDENIQPYLSYGVTRLLLNATIPPDFPTVAGLTAQLWAAAGRTPVDGVLRFDPAALAALVGFTGPVSVEGVDVPLTAENLEEFLLRGQYVQFPQEQAPRREVLEDVSEIVFDRLEQNNLPSPRIIGQVFAPLVAQGHVNAYGFDDTSARFLERIGLDGALPTPEDDALLVTTVNATGNKIDSFLRTAVRYVAADEDGRRTADLAVELTNDAPSGGLPFYVIGSVLDPPPPPGTNRTTLLLYTAMPIDEVRIGGSVVETAQNRSNGWWITQVPVEIGPGSSVRVEASLASEDGAGFETLRVLPGGGTAPDDYDIELSDDSGGTATFSGPVESPLTLDCCEG